MRKKCSANRKPRQAPRVCAEQSEAIKMTHYGAASLKKATTNTASLRERAIAQYHKLLLDDKTLAPRVFEKLHNAMRANRLVYDDRPISVALRPHLLERSQFEAHKVVAELIGRALEKIATAAVQSTALMTHLGLTDAEQKVALIDPAFRRAAVTTRLDGFVHGREIKFVEYNAENPSSLSDQEGLNRLLFDLPAMSIFAQRYRLRQFSPVKRLLATLLEIYHQWNGNGVPNIAIVDWKNLPTANEFVLLRDHFAARGVRAIICSPDKLGYKCGRLHCGDFEIDLVYKRVIVHINSERGKSIRECSLSRQTTRNWQKKLRRMPPHGKRTRRSSARNTGEHPAFKKRRQREQAIVRSGRPHAMRSTNFGRVIGKVSPPAFPCKWSRVPKKAC
jgi:hypothetical protein